MPLIITSFDFETTGVKAESDQVCSFSFIRVNTETRERQVFARLCKPSIVIPEEAIAIHGITNEMVANEPPFAHFIPEILKMIEGSILAGHNIIKFDIAMLHYELKRAGVHWMPDWTKVIDTLQAEREFYPADLTTVFNRYTGKVLEGAHGAAADSDAVLQIIPAMMAKHRIFTYEQLGELSTMKAGAMIDFEGKLKKNSSDIICFTFGKYKDWSVTEVMVKDPSYKDWLIKTFPNTSFLEKLNEIIASCPVVKK